MATAAKPKAKRTKKSVIVSKPVTNVVAKPAKPVVKSFKDLGTWQLAEELAVAVYRQCELFPQRDASVLSCQMTQSSVAVCANIAESFGRRGTEREKLFENALSALTRLDSYTLIAQDLGFLGKAQYADIDRRSGLTRWTLLKLQKINREWMGR